MKMQSRAEHKLNSAFWRILVGCVGLYPTLFIVLNLLKPITQELSFPLTVLVEVLVLVPITQLLSFPLAGWLISRLRHMVS